MQEEQTLIVALLAEGVDRNYMAKSHLFNALVALLAEGVDRNILRQALLSPSAVALLAEGVDRNKRNVVGNGFTLRRPPRGGRG